MSRTPARTLGAAYTRHAVPRPLEAASGRVGLSAQLGCDQDIGPITAVASTVHLGQELFNAHDGDSVIAGLFGFAGCTGWVCGDQQVAGFLRDTPDRL